MSSCAGLHRSITALLCAYIYIYCIYNTQERLHKNNHNTISSSSSFNQTGILYTQFKPLLSPFWPFFLVLTKEEKGINSNGKIEVNLACQTLYMVALPLCSLNYWRPMLCEFWRFGFGDIPSLEHCIYEQSGVCEFRKNPAVWLFLCSIDLCWKIRKIWVKFSNVRCVVV